MLISRCPAVFFGLVSLALLVPPVVRGQDHDCTHLGMKTVTNSVADLVTPIPNALPRTAGDNPAKPDKSRSLEELLIRLISTTVAPDSWDTIGGRGKMQYFPMGLALVVTQTPEVHEQIKEMMEGLRRLQNVEIAVEVRKVVVDSHIGDRFMTLAGFEQKQLADAEHPYKAALLTDKQVQGWFSYFQQSRHSAVMQAPKITLFNGQSARVSVGHNIAIEADRRVATAGEAAQKSPAVFCGVDLRTLPVVSPDLKSIRLHFNFKDTSVIETKEMVPATVTEAINLRGRPTTATYVYYDSVIHKSLEHLTLNTVLSIPDGGTTAIYLGTTDAETRNESGPPMLSKIPYQSRVLRNTAAGREKRQVFLLVTARVILNEEEEKQAVGEIPRVTASAACPCAKLEKSHTNTDRVTTVYSVADLVIPASAAPDPAPQTTEESLMLLIRQLVDSKSWVENGGNGTLQYFPLGLGLVVTQTPANQKRAADLLARLRMNLDQQIAVETRLVTVPRRLAEQFRNEAPFNYWYSDVEHTAIPVTFLHDQLLKDRVDGLQNDRRAEVSLPSVTTVLNCQEVNVNEMGINANILPMLTADGQYVVLSLKLNSTSKNPCAPSPSVDKALVVIPVDGPDEFDPRPGLVSSSRGPLFAHIHVHGTAVFDLGGGEFFFVTAWLKPPGCPAD